jgi:hypothetical protein
VARTRGRVLLGVVSGAIGALLAPRLRGVVGRGGAASQFAGTPCARERAGESGPDAPPPPHVAPSAGASPADRTTGGSA